MAISALPTPPSTSDPSTFATKADALLSALPTFVTEANALQTDVNAKQVTASDAAIAAEAAQAAAEAVSGALKWVSGTTYGEGEVAWSPITYRSYRRKVTGAGTTDPSLDGTNWSAVASFGSAGADIASASTVDLTTATGNTVVITGTTTVAAFTMNAGQQMVLIAAGAFQLTYHATTMNINGGANYTCAAGDRLYVTKDLAGVVRVNVTKQDGTAVVAASTVSREVFTSSGNFTVPTGITTIYVTAVAGGGAGGGCTGAGGTKGGSGGGAGGQVNKFAISVTPSDVHAVTIGAAGVGVSASTGGAGGDTILGSLLTVTGGTGGAANGGAAGVAGSLISTSGIVATIADGIGGSGGVTQIYPIATTGGTGGANGNTPNSSYYGNGGSGAGGGGGSAHTGGNGVKGLLIIEW